MQWHPRQNDLFEYTEGLVDGRATISAKIGRHVARCAACRENVAAIRQNLVMAQTAPALEPTAEFTANLLNAARNERILQCKASRHPLASMWALGKGSAYAATALLVAALSFHSALGTQSAATPVIVRDAPEMRVVASGPSPEEIRKATADVKLLTAAVARRQQSQVSLAAWQHLRAANALNADYSAALAALERNPGCVRALDLVRTSPVRQVQTLKRLYVEREL